MYFTRRGWWSHKYQVTWPSRSFDSHLTFGRKLRPSFSISHVTFWKSSSFTGHPYSAADINVQLSYKWRFIWRFKWSDRENARSQSWHLNGRWPVCFRMCRVNSSDLANFQPQPSHVHLYGFSPKKNFQKNFQKNFKKKIFSKK